MKYINKEYESKQNNLTLKPGDKCNNDDKIYNNQNIINLYCT